MTGTELALAGLAAVAAGAVNALAGGGTLITFPVLLASGVPPIAANVTSTVALAPGYLGAAMAQKGDLEGQRRRLSLFVPAGIVGGIAGGILLLSTGDRLFRALIPALILSASGILAVQERVRGWVQLRSSGVKSSTASLWGIIPVVMASVYGGYFGAGLSVIVLAVLGLAVDDSITRLNALKQAISFSVNSAAAIFFLFSSQVVWPAVLMMASGAVIGGILGGRLAGRIRPSLLRWIVVWIGIGIGCAYLLQNLTA